MFKCECGYTHPGPAYPVYCKCGRIHYKSTESVDALANGLPGTELARLIAGDITLGPFHINISKLGFTPSSNCNCQTRIDIMNQWGPDGCVQNKDTIVKWLQEAAIAEGIYYLHRFFYSKLVDLAIYNARTRKVYTLPPQ